jgi:hypothetical protein
MMIHRKIIASFFLSMLLLFTACGSNEPPSRFEGAQQESTQGQTSAVSDDAVKGGSLNQFFPNSGNGYERVFTQEKTGFAEAKLKKDGKEMAIMAISDTSNNPEAQGKFKESKEKIGGYPSINQGKTATAVLVGDRFQVKLMSKDPSFTESDRKVWLEKFDLNGLSRLK